MNKKELFKKAHEMTREIKAEYPEINYRVQFSLCLSALHFENKKKEGIKMVELQGTEKQVKWAGDIRKATFENIKTAIDKIEEIQVSRIKRAKLYDRRIATLQELVKTLENETSAKVFIEEYRSQTVSDFMNI